MGWFEHGDSIDKALGAVPVEHHDRFWFEFEQYLETVAAPFVNTLIPELRPSMLIASQAQTLDDEGDPTAPLWWAFARMAADFIAAAELLGGEGLVESDTNF